MICLQESLCHEFPNQFKNSFPTSQFKILHHVGGQGLVSLINLAHFPKDSEFTISDATDGQTLAHLLQITAPGHTKISLLNVYQPPSAEEISENIIRLMDSVDYICGDFNTYTLRFGPARDTQLMDWVSAKGLMVSSGNSFEATFDSQAASSGPDFILQSIDSDFGAI